MANVKFKEWQCNDGRPAITQETAIDRCLRFSGIHHTSFADWITDAMDVDTSLVSDISDAGWEGEEGTWDIYHEFLYGTGGGAARWYKLRYSTPVELGFVATFNKRDDRSAFLICSDTSYNGYLVWWTGTAVGVTEVAGDTETVLISVPCTEDGEAHVTVAVWPQRTTSIDTIDNLSICLWFDDKHLLTYTMEYEAKGTHIGFAVYQADSVRFSELNVPQLHQLTEWTSVDPGQTASSGLARALGQDEIRVQARYDGSVYVWRNTGADSDWTLPTKRPVTVLQQNQIYKPGHIRLVGALHEIDNFRAGDQGHIFGVLQDPNALSEKATADRADRRHKTAVEGADSRSFMTPPNVLLEPEDVITYDGATWRISTLSYRIGRQGDISYVLSSRIEARDCL